MIVNETSIYFCYIMVLPNIHVHVLEFTCKKNQLPTMVPSYVCTLFKILRFVPPSPPTPFKYKLLSREHLLEYHSSLPIKRSYFVPKLNQERLFLSTELQEPSELRLFRLPGRFCLWAKYFHDFLVFWIKKELNFLGSFLILIPKFYSFAQKHLWARLWSSSQLN